jgi:hypothetical protein
MERRIFLKAGTLAIFSLYGFPEKIFGFPGEKLPAAGEAHKGRIALPVFTLTPSRMTGF